MMAGVFLTALSVLVFSEADAGPPLAIQPGKPGMAGSSGDIQVRTLGRGRLIQRCRGACDAIRL
jgi:hypothetical protein